jgi:hypothetical protein
MIKILSALFFCLLAASVFAGQGWYLLTPLKEGPEGIRAPLTTWDHHGSYDTATDCENSLMRTVESRKQRIKEGTDDARKQKINQQILDRLTWARCIASDDPRLK